MIQGTRRQGPLLGPEVDPAVRLWLARCVLLVDSIRIFEHYLL